MTRHDIVSLDAINSAEQEDADGLLASAEHIRQLISAEEDTAGIPPDRWAQSNCISHTLRRISGVCRRSLCGPLEADALAPRAWVWSRVVVAGFSQGGAIALLMLRQNARLAGIVGLSTYLTLRSRPPLVSATNADTPVFCAHGTADQVVRRLSAPIWK